MRSHRLTRANVTGLCRALLLLLAWPSVGCTLARSVQAVGQDRDASALDAASSDAGSIDAASDAEPLDASDLDVGAPDTGPPDPPDTGPPDTGPASCDSQYSTAIGYVPCAERETECEFASTLESVRTCGTTCAALGGRCLDAYRNEKGFPTCERQGEPLGCDVFHNDDICICSRGP